MNIKTLMSAAVVAACSFAGSSQAASLISNHDSLAKSASETATFEFLNDANVYGIEFDVVFADGVQGINVANCLQSLGKAFSISRCAEVGDNRVRVMVLSGERSTVPDGVVAQIGFDGSKISGQDAFVVENVIFGSRGGLSITPEFVDRAAVPDFGDTGSELGRQVQ